MYLVEYLLTHAKLFVTLVKDTFTHMIRYGVRASIVYVNRNGQKVSRTDSRETIGYSARAFTVVW